jgi:hypothetical protein
MFAKFPIQKVSQPALDSEKSQSSQSTLDIVVLQKFAVALDECNEESLLGGSWTGEDTLRPRLNAPDEPAKTVVSYYGIRSIPTLM